MVNNNYLEIIKSLKSSKEGLNEDQEKLNHILNQSNDLFDNISNTSDLKLDARITELHSHLYLRAITRNIQKKKNNIRKFINMVNKGEIEKYIEDVEGLNRSVKFTSFIDFNFVNILKTRKIGERIKRNVKDLVVTQGVNNLIEEEENPFFSFLDSILNQTDKILFFKCVLNNESFDMTVENLFNLSLAVRSKRVMLVSQNESVYVTKFKEVINDTKFDEHAIMELDYEKYKRMIDSYLDDQS